MFNSELPTNTIATPIGANNVAVCTVEDSILMIECVAVHLFSCVSVTRKRAFKIRHTNEPNAVFLKDLHLQRANWYGPTPCGSVAKPII